MLRWLIRLSGAAFISALLIWLWNRFNQDLLEEEPEEEVPLEFDVPDTAPSAPPPSSSAGGAHNGTHASTPVLDTGEAAPATGSSSPAGSVTDAAAPPDAAAPEDAGTTEDANATEPEPVLDSPAPTPPGAGDNVIAIKGIGPKYGAKLAEMGITTFGALLATPMDTLMITFPRVSEAELHNWLEQARELAEQSGETA
jgi:predicted flap endonuclease-1-like 5' DNA nuclease